MWNGRDFYRIIPENATDRSYVCPLTVVVVVFEYVFRCCVAQVKPNIKKITPYCHGLIVVVVLVLAL